MTAAHPPAGGAIEVRGLTKRFGSVVAVQDVSFTVVPGRVTGFLGPNGAGKTTTLRMLLGLVNATSGAATIDGVAYRDLPTPTRRVGAVLEATSFHPARRARNHLKMIALAAGIEFSRIDEVLDLVGLAGDARRRVGGFSTGMRQRLELAGALLGDPGVLILDEPSNGLDPQGIAWLREFLRHLAREGRTVLVSSHLLAEMAQTVDDVVILSQGVLRAQGPLSSLVAQSRSSMRVRTPEPDRLLALVHQMGLSRAGWRPTWWWSTGPRPSSSARCWPPTGSSSTSSSRRARTSRPSSSRSPPLTAPSPARPARGHRRPPAVRGHRRPPAAGGTARRGTAGKSSDRAAPAAASGMATDPGLAAPGRASGRGWPLVIRTLRAELFKMRTTPGLWILFGVTVLLTGLFGIIPTFFVTSTPGHTVFTAPASVHHLRELVGAGYSPGVLLAPVLGVLCITTEYRQRLLTATLLVTPAPRGGAGGQGLRLGDLGPGARADQPGRGGGARHPALRGRGWHRVHTPAPGRAPVVPGLLGAYALLAVFGMGIGTLLRNQVGAVIFALALTIVLEPLIVLLVHLIFHADLNWFPYALDRRAGRGPQRLAGQRRRGTAAQLVGGGLALLAWGVGMAVIGYFTTFRRDVT